MPKQSPLVSVATCRSRYREMQGDVGKGGEIWGDIWEVATFSSAREI